MKSICRTLFLGVLCFGLANIVAAQQVALNFYQARIAVADQTASERNRAAGEGLKQVLVRVSGTLNIEQSAAITKAMAKAATYVDQFQYALERDEWGGKQEYLELSFAPKVIERLLLDGALPFWPINRPKILVWLVEDLPDDGKRLVNDTASPMVVALQQAATVRGLPLRFPLLDLDDQLALPADRLWAMDEREILDASERYALDTVLVGRYTQTSSGQWWSTWQFFHRGDNHLFDLRVDDIAQMGLQVIGPMADYLAGLYAIVPSHERTPQLAVQVSGVSSFGDFQELLKYFQQMAVVTSLNLVSVTGNTVLLSVQLNGSLEQLNNAISLDKKIRSDVAQQVPTSPWMMVQRGTSEQPLLFQWVGS